MGQKIILILLWFFLFFLRSFFKFRFNHTDDQYRLYRKRFNAFYFARSRREERTTDRVGFFLFCLSLQTGLVVSRTAFSLPKRRKLFRNFDLWQRPRWTASKTVFYAQSSYVPGIFRNEFSPSPFESTITLHVYATRIHPLIVNDECASRTKRVISPFTVLARPWWTISTVIQRYRISVVIGLSPANVPHSNGTEQLPGDFRTSMFLRLSFKIRKEILAHSICGREQINVDVYNFVNKTRRTNKIV